MLGTSYYHCDDDARAFQNGVKLSSICVDSILVNGYGKYRNHTNPSHSFPSIKQIYNVRRQASRVKLRIMHAGFEYPIRLFRLDGMSLLITAADGGDILPVEVTDLIVGIAETVDVELLLPEKMENFNIRVQLLVQCKGKQCDPIYSPHVDIGIQRSHLIEISPARLLFEEPTVPINQVASCTPQNDGRCSIFNCPWKNWSIKSKNAESSEKKCKFINEARRNTTQDHKFHIKPPMSDEKPDKIFNVTLNFSHGSAINNMRFKYPKVPLYHDPVSWEFVECPEMGDVPPEGIQCTQVLTAEVGELIELRLVGTEHPDSWRRKLRTYHTVHLHSHDFYLMSMGFPQLFDNGTIAGLNENLHCVNSACTVHEWNEEALQEALQNQRDDHIAKNTLMLPSQGYAIVRFRATNPGYWPLHCHNLMHAVEGMMLLFHINDSLQNRPFSMIPDGLPQCLNHLPSVIYPWDITSRVNNEYQNSIVSPDDLDHKYIQSSAASFNCCYSISFFIFHSIILN